MPQPDLITAHIQHNQLASAMNKTKWRKLAIAMTSNPDFEPQTRIKHLLDRVAMGFSAMHWDWMEAGDVGWVEWLELDPIHQEYVGQLVADKQTDYTDWLRATLRREAIPFEEVDGIFRIQGYIRPNP
ncbi:hypothetical protein D0N36_05475 [Hymenobacter lapidiphilus]|uniref:DUF6678 family protein n=1 Tax=Hymenobacter sp. CCM 8763 TaxID=2303334 RepID=UPI000E3559C1|nr:DUF6678 family protein [Hymenobacter sp. CCM 8763]RFP66168.1 hypothetical protein D0N36_05475 [Hymenobacter sp. CCM 8763]